ncbi:MAG TPA: sigma-70 family RNA polymerase sigma factor [Blastocatellia bacterium]|nr:sigma-70 family RNA polymerase sigma factor [Blastocatellia bacterium]
MDERRVIESFLSGGTEEAFCALFEVAWPRVRRYFLLRGLDAMTAEDLAQNVLFIAYQRAGEVREKDLFYGWLFAVARNELMRYWRRHQSRVGAPLFEPVSAELADSLTVEPDVMRDSHLQEWLTYLEPAERDLVVLRFVEELSYEELALALAIPLGTVKWRIFNAKKKLSQIIRASFPESITKRIN